MTQEDAGFQPEPGCVRWRMYFRVPPDVVYALLATPQGRRRFWAESAEERDGKVHFIVPGGLESEGRVLESDPDRLFVVEYFGWTVRFELQADPENAATDMEMTCTNVPEAHRMEVAAGWVSVLMAMKAAAEFNADLRNHDPERSWWNGYADN